LFAGKIPESGMNCVSASDACMLSNGSGILVLRRLRPISRDRRRELISRGVDLRQGVYATHLQLF
jgi:hypothetical protein